MEELLRLIEERKDELFASLSEMIKIDSQSFGDTATGREEEMARHLEKCFRQLGLEPDFYSPLDAGIEQNDDYYAGRHLENRYNCAAVFPGKDHSRRIMLAAHEDTVMVGDPATWSVDPFGGEIKDGRIYGRGACDDKYALAVVLYIVKLMKELNIELPFDVVIAGYSDEENGGSNGALASALRYPCDEAISLDGHCMEIVASGAGGGVVKASLVCDDICDSCARMFDGFAVLREEWERFADRRKAEFLEKPYFKDSEIPNTTVRYTDVHSGMGGSTMGRLEALITFYTIHDEEETKAEWAEMNARINEKLAPLHMHIEEYEMFTRFCHFVETESGNKAMALMREIVKDVVGEDHVPCGMCLSDLPMFMLHASPRSFGFGCGRSFAQEGGAHQVNEFVECDDLVKYAKAIATFLMKYEIEK